MPQDQLGWGLAIAKFRWRYRFALADIMAGHEKHNFFRH
jgi:hypothetical protein